MYIEYKGDDIFGPVRVGRAIFSKTGRSLSYRGKRFASLSGAGFKANYYDEETRERYWISGCKKDGSDALYSTVVEIDEDVREEYWREVRGRPELSVVTSIKTAGKYAK